MSVNLFTYSSLSVQFSTPFVRDGSEETLDLYQPRGLDSLLREYCYTKSLLCRVRQTLTVRRVTAAVLADLRVLLDAVDSSKETFSWYDHLGALHTVRYVAQSLTWRQTGPDRYEVSLAIEEDTANDMHPAGPNTFDACLAAQDRVRPVWILRLVINGTDYYLSDSVFTVAATTASPTPRGWPHDTEVTTWALIGRWGELRESLSGGQNEIHTADFDAEILHDAALGIITLAESYPLEDSPAELYLWYYGLDGEAEPPRLRFRGYVRDVEIPDESRVALTIQDESIRLERAYVGWKANPLIFPGIDPDDVGKVVPIPYGDVAKVPALAVDAGLVTTIPAALTSTATTITLSEVGDLAEGSTIQVDEEQILLGPKSGTTFTGSTRGSGGTLAAAHQKGAAAWEVQAEMVYLPSAVPLTALPRVWGRLGKRDLDITAVCSRYLGVGASALVGLGELGGQHPSYPGWAVVTVPGYITVSQAINLLVNDGIDVNDAIAVVDTIAVNNTLSVSETIGIANTLDTSTGSHSHETLNNSSVNRIAMAEHSGGDDFHTSCPPENAYDGDSSSYYWPTIGVGQTAAFKPDSTPSVGVPTRVRARIDYEITGGGGTGGTNNWLIYVNSSLVETIPNTGDVTRGVGVTNWFAINGWSDLLAAGTHIDLQNYNASIKVFDLSWEVEASSNYTLTNSANVSLTGGVSKTGTVSQTGNVTKSGSAAKSGSATKTGTVTLSGNSLANTLICDTLLVDMSRDVHAPADVVTDFLFYAGATPPAVQQEGSFPASYRFDFVVTEYRPVREWCDMAAFQARAWFRPSLGVARLIVRPDTPTSIATIDACRVDGGRKILSSRKTPFSDIVNKIELLFDRDWTKSGAEAYRQSLKDEDAGSIAIYRLCESPSLWQFDLVRDATMAADLLAFYLTMLKNRRWQHTFQTFLTSAERKFGDGVTLDFKGSALATVISAGVRPGDKDTIDVCELMVEGSQPVATEDPDPTILRDANGVALRDEDGKIIREGGPA